MTPAARRDAAKSFRTTVFVSSRVLSQVRDALYAPRTRALVEKVTGCGAIDPDKMDLSANVYAKGGHLLCHDDVIGSRLVSFVLRVRRAERPRTSRDAAAAARRGYSVGDDESRRRRRGYGDESPAAATWMFRGDESRRRRRG